MNEQDKLRVLIPHWIEHNQDHMEEFRKWAQTSGESSGDILSAVDSITQANAHLAVALEKLGGPLEYHHSH
jgi:hypothetical protein